MALLYRKTVRDAITAVLADPVTGFNARLAASAVEYGITPFEIDWGGSSGNFALSQIDPANVEICSLLNFPAAMLYTEEAADTGLPRGITFSGQVTACLEIIQRRRDGIETFDTESLTDAIEDAAMSAVNDPAVRWPISQSITAIFARQNSVSRDHLMPLGDGYGIRTKIRMLFEVKAR